MIKLTEQKKTRTDQSIQTYQKFMRNVRKCSDVIRKPSLTNDICLNGIECIQEQIIPMRSGNVNLKKAIACQCPTQKYKFNCSQMYCTTDKYSCDHLMKLKKKQVKSCNNSKTKTRKILSIF